MLVWDGFLDNQAYALETFLQTEVHNRYENIFYFIKKAHNHLEHYRCGLIYRQKY